MKYNKFLEDLELIDSDHKNFSIDTPLRKDAFKLSDAEKISIIEKNVQEILFTLGMDMSDVIGLSKMNRVVDYFSRRPQVQERLTIQIVKTLQKMLKTEDVACVIDAKHMCVNSRGIRHVDCSTVTGEFGGKFKDQNVKREFLDYIRNE